VFYVYVLRSESDSGFYIGFSTNLRARLRQHQASESFATKSRGPWKLIYYEAYTEREDAERREKFLKSGARRRFETRSFPTLPRCFPRSFTFYVAHPVRSIRAPQLRHYLRVNGFASRGSDHGTARFH
jgi:putative endonuclease